MNAKKCDRCGAYYMEKEQGAFDFIIKDLHETVAGISGQRPRAMEMILKVVDLCPSCTKDLRRWWSRILFIDAPAETAPTDREEQNNGEL